MTMNLKLKITKTVNFLYNLPKTRKLTPYLIILIAELEEITVYQSLSIPEIDPKAM